MLIRSGPQPCLHRVETTKKGLRRFCLRAHCDGHQSRTAALDVLVDSYSRTRGKSVWFIFQQWNEDAVEVSTREKCGMVLGKTAENRPKVQSQRCNNSAARGLFWVRMRKCRWEWYMLSVRYIKKNQKRLKFNNKILYIELNWEIVPEINNHFRRRSFGNNRQLNGHIVE